MTDKPRRKTWTQKDRARIFLKHDGICGLSGVKIGPDDAWEIEHRIPWALTHDDSDENVYPALTAPHAIKTKDDVRRIAKAKRQARETGRQKIGKQKKKIPNRGFDKTLRKRLNGTVERVK